MAWCPSCKLEYVEGVTVCPDCKSALVASLDETCNQDSSEGFENGYDAENFYSEGEKASEIEAQMAQMEMMARMKKIVDNPPYKPKDEQLSENKSGATVLIIFGFVGILVLVLNALGIIYLPMTGYSLTLLNIVMGTLFFVFLISGVRAALKVKRLTPEVAKEKEDIEIVTEFIKSKRAEGKYVINKDSYEVSYLEVSEKAVKDIEEAYPDLPQGFAFYVVDRFGNEILDED